MKIKAILGIAESKIRKVLNPILGPLRRIPLVRAGKDKFTIISNNCWGGFVYQWFNLEYNSPTIGLYLFSDDYIKFIYDIKKYLAIKPEFITLEESRHYKTLKKYGGGNLKCPIGKFDDIEIIFLHYKSSEEVLDKWNRRKKRICWDNIFFKMSEQNDCTREHLLEFDRLPAKNKVLFTSKDYGLKSQILYTEYLNADHVIDDIKHFRRYINVTRWLLEKDGYKKRQ